MLNETIVTSPAPAMPATLRYIQNGDSLGTANHQNQAEDVAQALGHLKATKADLAGPALTGTATAVNLTVSGTTDLNGTTTLDGATTAGDFTLSGTNKVKLASRSIARVQAVPFTADVAAVWSTNVYGEAVQANSSLGYAIFELRVPHGATLTSVTAYVTGGAGHGSLPTSTDRVELSVGYTTTGGSHPGLGTQADTATLPTYEAQHTIAVSMSHVIDRTANRYFATIRSERGANYQAGYTVHCVSCTYTITAMDED